MDSLYLYYPLSRTSLCRELLLWPIEHFHQIHLRACLHVTEMKFHPGMKKILFTREFHPGMKFSLKENL